MTYTKKEISDLVNSNGTEEELVDIQGIPSSVVLGTIYEKPEISFVLHEGNPDEHAYPDSQSMTYILMTFKPQENQITPVTSVLQAQTKLTAQVRIEGMYKTEKENKIVYVHTITTGSGYREIKKGETKWTTTYRFVSEDTIKRIVEKKE